MSINNKNSNYRKLVDSIPNNVQFLFSTEEISTIQRGVIVDNSDYIYSSFEKNIIDSEGDIWTISGDIIKYSPTGSVIDSVSVGPRALRKYDSDLNLLSSLSTNFNWSISIDDSDNIYVASDREGSPVHSVSSVSPTASVRWEYDTGRDALAIYTNNNYVFVGEGEGTFSINPRITILSLTGSLIKTISVPSNLRFSRNDITSDSDNNIYMRTSDNNNNDNSVVRKLDFDSNVLWTRTDISSIYGGIFLDGDYVYVSGSTNDTVNPAVGYSVLKLDKNTGNLIWVINKRSTVTSTVDFTVYVKGDTIYTAGSNLCSPDLDCSNPKRGPVVIYSQN